MVCVVGCLFWFGGLEDWYWRIGVRIEVVDEVEVGG